MLSRFFIHLCLLYATATIPVVSVQASPVRLALVARAPPDPTQITISSITLSGSGCPDSTTNSISISEDRRAFTVTFSSNIAQIAGTFTPPVSNTLVCNVAILVKYPSANIESATMSTTRRGFIDIASGLQATSKLTYTFDGVKAKSGLNTYTSTASYSGPLGTEFFVGNSQIHPGSLVLAKCKKDTLINLKLETTVTTSNMNTGIMTLDSIDGEFSGPQGTALLKDCVQSS